MKVHSRAGALVPEEMAAICHVQRGECLKFNIIGAGRLGKNIARALLTHNKHELVAIYNKSIQSSTIAAKELGCGMAVDSLSMLPPVEVTFITTPDDSIADIAKALIISNSIVIHCSGVLSSDVLAPLKHQHNAIASLHPLKAFRKDSLQTNAFKNCDCVIEGDDVAVEQLTNIFTELGAQVIPIHADKKATYHAGAVMASNYMVTLAHCAIDLFTHSGLSNTQAKDITQKLMQSSLSNIQQASLVADALTGPLARGDLNTVCKHLAAINTPDVNALYRAAAIATLPLTPLTHEVQAIINKVLDEK